MNTRGTTKNNNNINQFDLSNTNNTSEHQHPQPEHNTFSSISLPIMNPDSIPADHDWQRTLMSEEQEPILNRRQTVDSNHQSNMLRRGYHEIPSKNFSHPILKTSQYSAQTNLRNTLLNASAQFSGENNPISNSSTEIESIQHQEEMFSNHDSSAASPTSTQLYPQETLLEMCRDLDLLMSDVSQIPDVVQGSNSTGFDSLPSSSVQQQQQPLLSSTLNNYFTNFGVDNETQLNEQQHNQSSFSTRMNNTFQPTP
ncbi:hypothetical protein C9374_009208 [Naegleria lovaniensis]|uniref:Uncharacterized protein n=1 Tax=Naegleria lovaniensis TaxID=51637 RepID=A0AA88GE03_NAELO|nr:uncharacterized protein C9374_009208 [Naegleria lovaniensis]KAG2377692.1 hypothetical protein C9374_009208 [Naegleria lovaniensis]